MKLHAQVRFPERGVDLTLAVDAGRTLALLGPNGAGKSTALASIAGLLRPASGQITLDDRILFSGNDSTMLRQRLQPRRVGAAARARGGPAGPGGPAVPPPVGAGQRRLRPTQCRYAARPGPRAGARSGWLEVDAEDFADRRPAALSGGQAQRVAIARALATEPHLLLLDEPLSALDVESAPAIRQLLRRVLEDRTTILVTHDILDAVLLADDVAVARGRAGRRAGTHGPGAHPADERLRRPHRRTQPGARNRPRGNGLRRPAGCASRDSPRTSCSDGAGRPSPCSARTPSASTCEAPPAAPATSSAGR